MFEAWCKKIIIGYNLNCCRTLVRLALIFIFHVLCCCFGEQDRDCLRKQSKRVHISTSRWQYTCITITLERHLQFEIQYWNALYLYIWFISSIISIVRNHIHPESTVMVFTHGVKSRPKVLNIWTKKMPSGNVGTVRLVNQHLLSTICTWWAARQCTQWEGSP